MELTKHLTLDGQDPEEAWARARVYWEGRGFDFGSLELEPLLGRRGSAWGNLTAFDDMSALRAELSLWRAAEDELLCALSVDTRLQAITEWNRAYWELELATFESFVLRGELREAEWADFSARARRANVRWALSLGLLGRRKG